ncbi:hypothetical protein NS228_12350 [Methylobacterium indicum]|nr:hypothetical protein NS229_10995 [Methylobacterium indicum]KTS40151.1 hypothetical protein NS228_12350 [Methylobacterium indicum]KTS53236.1 hypothetical protein NS230_06870 [Methylobacterium indicum]
MAQQRAPFLVKAHGAAGAQPRNEDGSQGREIPSFGSSGATSEMPAHHSERDDAVRPDHG